MLHKIIPVIALVTCLNAVSSSVFALDPPDRRKITDEDKVYFGMRLDMMQIERLGKIITREKIASNSPCDKADAIKSDLRFMKEMLPIFREASKSADISAYTRRYSASLVQEMTGTAKALQEISPRYKSMCASMVEER